MTPGQRYDLTVRASYSQYLLDSSRQVDDPWPDPIHGLTTGEEDWLAILTGTQYGPVTVHLAVTGAQPERVESGWDMVGERDLSVPTGTVNVGGPGDTPELQLRLEPGLYRVRIHVRGRAQAQPYGYLEKPMEEHLILLWPSQRPQPPARLTDPDDYASTGIE